MVRYIAGFSMNTKSFKTGRVVIISLSHFFHDIYSSFLSPLLPFFIEKHGLSLKMAGALAPVYRSTSLIQPLIGYSTDRGSVVRLFPLTIVISGITMSFLVACSSYTQLLAVIFIGGTSATLFHGIALTLVSGSSGKQYGTGMSMFMTGGELARSFGPLFIVTLLKFLPPQFVPVAAVPGIAAASILFIPGVAVHQASLKRGNMSFKDALRKGGRGLALLILIGSIHTYTVYSFSLFLPVFLKEEGSTLFAAGSALTVLEISGAFGALAGGFVSDRIGRKPFFLLSSISVSVLINLFLSSSGYGSRLVFLLFTGVFMFSNAPVRYAFSQELVPEMKGTVSSVLMAFGFLTTTVSAVLSGQMGDAFGLYTTFRIVSFIPLLSIPLILSLPPSRSGGRNKR